MIYDTDGNRKLSSHISLRPSEVVTETVLIDCLDGWQLSGHAVADVTIECRHDGDADVDIEATPIDLSAWDGDRETFIFTYTAGAHGSASAKQFTFSVSRA